MTETINSARNARNLQQLAPFDLVTWTELYKADPTGELGRTARDAVRALLTTGDDHGPGVDAAWEAFSKRLTEVGQVAEFYPFLEALTVEGVQRIADARAAIVAGLPDCDCGHRPEPSFYGPGGTFYTEPLHTQGVLSGIEISFPGYAIKADGSQDTLCLNCATDHDREAIAATTGPVAFFGYLSSDGTTVTTWTGRVLFAVTRETSNERQTFIRATDTQGRTWSGRGAGRGMVMTMRLAKRHHKAAE